VKFLPQDIQDEIRTYFKDIDFEGELNQVNDAFTKWRYLHEKIAAGADVKFEAKPSDFAELKYLHEGTVVRANLKFVEKLLNHLSIVASNNR